jgi:subfamily B ATP-binding cassette protein MsbA
LNRRAHLGRLGALFGQFARPRAGLLLLFALLSAVTAALTTLQPLVLAPAIHAAVRPRAAAAPSLARLSLNNLGATATRWLGLDESADRLDIVLTSVVLYVGLVALASGLGFASARLMRSVRLEAAADVRRRLFGHLVSLPLLFFRGRRAGELSSRFVADVTVATQSLELAFRRLPESLLQLLVYGWILGRTDRALAATVGAVMLLHVTVNRLLESRIRRQAAASVNVQGTLHSWIQEAVQGMRVVKSFSAERFESERFSRKLGGVNMALLRHHLFTDSEVPMRQVVNALALGTAVTMSFAALAVGRLTLPGFILFVLIARQAIGPFSQLGRCILQLHAAAGASTRLIEILDQRPALEDGDLEAPPLERSITLRDVVFAYEPGPPVLDGINLEIPRGDVVALVGPSGAGKTTLADLVLRLHDPTAGCVAYDGTDVRRFRQESYRRRFGVVPQDALLFGATIEENVAYGRPLVPGEVARAARIANAEEFILRLPDGYRTSVGERGSRLSGGERQRISIARALYGRPEVLVLDEATSGLDSDSERQVQAATFRALEGATALVIAHRLSTIMRADTIVVLDRGRIESIGPHEGLLETSPVYRRLYDAQFRDAAVEAAR